jgi:hypothetical protein
MATSRAIQRVTRSKPTIEGAGVHLRRAFGFGDTTLFDPFLLLDDFRSDEPADYVKGFPWHPHRGIETITYVLTGSVAHGDSMGNEGVIGPGDVQWMTAGSGIIHQEMPDGDRAGRMYGFQLWANLPSRWKMMPPRYQEVLAETVPEVQPAAGTRARVIAGTVAGATGPVRDIVIDPGYLDITLVPGASYALPTPRGHTLLAYVFEGSAEFGPAQDAYAYPVQGAGYFDTERGAALGNHSLIVFGDGDFVEARAGEAGVRFLLISGKPIGEPVAWYGPVVMNTEAELRTAFQELRAGTFIKK